MLKVDPNEQYFDPDTRVKGPGIGSKLSAVKQSMNQSQMPMKK
jgi:hypothetical protein